MCWEERKKICNLKFVWVIRTEDGLFGGAAIYTQGNLPFDDESLLGWCECLFWSGQLSWLITWPLFYHAFLLKILNISKAISRITKPILGMFVLFPKCWHFLQNLLNLGRFWPVVCSRLPRVSVELTIPPFDFHRTCIFKSILLKYNIE